VRLSEGERRPELIAAVSVAAHEVGHAIQDATGYLPMKARAGLFPIVNFAGQLWFPLFFIAFITGVGTATGQFFIQLAALAFLGILAFHVVTLPVEINASTRAYGLLTRYGIPLAQRGGWHQARVNGGGLHLHSGGADRAPDAPVLVLLEPERVAG
jgi:Zn-dependent membrane protease YugP